MSLWSSLENGRERTRPVTPDRMVGIIEYFFENGTKTRISLCILRNLTRYVLNGAMRTAVLIMFFCSMLAVPASLGAEDPGVRSEIDHLIAYVQHSDCIFIRNGREYSAVDAAGHILKKYEHFRKEIDSAEKFIELCATGSLISGQPYLIHCPGNAVTGSREWLLRELERYRAGTE